MPGFTADASAYRPSSTYRAVYGTLVGNASAMVMPQQVRFGIDPCDLFCNTHVTVPCVTGCIVSTFGFGGIGGGCNRVCRAAHNECVDLCRGGGGGTPPPSRPQNCSTDVCPPFGELPCCGGLVCDNGFCVPRGGGYTPSHYTQV
jgi:hypothetical protein